MAQEKTKEEKNFDWLERTIEGLLNDFEGGITEKEETMNQFFELIFDKLVAEIQELRDKLSSQLEPQVKVQIASKQFVSVTIAYNELTRSSDFIQFSNTFIN